MDYSTISQNNFVSFKMIPPHRTSRLCGNTAGEAAGTRAPAE